MVTATIGILGVVATPTIALADDDTTLITLPGDLSSRPEGIANDGRTLYVSSVANGTIFTADIDDSAAEVFLPAGSDGRTSATGLKAANGLLYISGAATGKVFVYDIATKALRYTAQVAAGGSTFINDVAVARDGTAYFTDSNRPLLYRVMPTAGGSFTFETFIDFTGTAFVYQPGFNANGITLSEDGQIRVSCTGKHRKVVPNQPRRPLGAAGRTRRCSAFGRRRPCPARADALCHLGHSWNHEGSIA